MASPTPACSSSPGVGKPRRWGPAADLVGLHPTHPTARYDRMGMPWFLKGERVVALTATEARFSRGLAFHRRP